MEGKDESTLRAQAVREVSEVLRVAESPRRAQSFDSAKGAKAEAKALARGA
jgi:hypothetical protein